MFRKILYILLLLNLLRIIPGCCECDEATRPFSFNKTDIVNLNNTGPWPEYTDSDTMRPAAVAFSVSLFDSAGYFYAQAPVVETFGFSKAQAFAKCDCAFPFMANQHLTDIRIESLTPLSPDLPAGDVSALFVAKPTSNAASGNLYIPLNDLCRQTIGKVYYDGGIESFELYLKTTVQHAEVRFAFQFTFSDNLVLRDTTRLITIAER